MLNWKSWLAIALLIPCAASASETLARSKSCFACHAMDRKIVGPAFNDVMTKYRGDAAAAEYLARKITKGGGGVWGSVPMPANILSNAETRELVAWLLASGSSGVSHASQPTLTDDPKTRERSDISTSTQHNSTHQTAANDITQQCREEDSKNTRRYLQEAMAAIQRGDMAAANQANLANGRAKLDLYQGRCAAARDASDKVATAKQGIAMAGGLIEQQQKIDSSRAKASNSGSRIYSDDPSKQSFSSDTAERNSVGSTARAVTECVRMETSNTGSGGGQLRNTCGYSVEVGWCVIGYDCKYGDYGFTNQLTLKAGAAYPISGSSGRLVNFGACTPINSSILSISRTEIQCR